MLVSIAFGPMVRKLITAGVLTEEIAHGVQDMKQRERSSFPYMDVCPVTFFNPSPPPKQHVPVAPRHEVWWNIQYPNHKILADLRKNTDLP